MSNTGKDPSEHPDVSGQEDSGHGESDARMSDGAVDGGKPSSDAEPARVEPASAPEPETEEITQADIDALMASTTGSVAPTSPPTPDLAKAPPAPAPHSDSQDVSQSDIDALFAAGGATESAAEAAVAAPGAPVVASETETFDLAELGSSTATGIDAKRVTMLNDVNLRVKLQLGQTRMLVEDVLKLGEGSLVELDKLAGDPVDVVVNDRLVARGEVLVLNDNFCVRVTEVLSHDPHRVTV